MTVPTKWGFLNMARLTIGCFKRASTRMKMMKNKMAAPNQPNIWGLVQCQS